jgi:hypothetical protein
MRATKSTVAIAIAMVGAYLIETYPASAQTCEEKRRVCMAACANTYPAGAQRDNCLDNCQNAMKKCKSNRSSIVHDLLDSGRTTLDVVKNN